MNRQTNETNLSRCDMSLFEQAIDFQFNCGECLSQRTGYRQVRIQGGKSGSEDRAVQTREEWRHGATAIRGDAVAMGMRNAPDNSLETQAAQIIGQLVGRVR